MPIRIAGHTESGSGDPSYKVTTTAFVLSDQRNFMPPSRFARALKPIVAGILIDLVDFATLGPIGIYLGFLLGGLLGYWICSIYKLRPLHRFLGALITGIYCTLPFTAFIPAATLMGAYIEFLVVKPVKEDSTIEVTEDTEKKNEESV